MAGRAALHVPSLQTSVTCNLQDPPRFIREYEKDVCATVELVIHHFDRFLRDSLCSLILACFGRCQVLVAARGRLSSCDEKAQSTGTNCRAPAQLPWGHVGSSFSDQGSNPCTLHWKHRVLTHWPTRELPWTFLNVLENQHWFYCDFTVAKKRMAVRIVWCPCFLLKGAVLSLISSSINTIGEASNIVKELGKQF